MLRSEGEPMTKQTCGPIYALVIASLMVPAVALALMADRALAAEPQMPEPLHGTWCSDAGVPGLYGPSDYWNGPCKNPDGNPLVEIEVTSTQVNSRGGRVSCEVRKVTQFDMCPWGMIFKNRERARALRSFQINPWGPGYNIVLQCTHPALIFLDPSFVTGDLPSFTIKTDWSIQKGVLHVGDEAPRDVARCPWDRRGTRR